MKLSFSEIVFKLLVRYLFEPGGLGTLVSQRVKPSHLFQGKMNQSDRTETIATFYNADKGALFCTDLAARGLDIPAVDWIVQFDPPSDTNVSYLRDD